MDVDTRSQSGGTRRSASGYDLGPISAADRDRLAELLRAVRPRARPRAARLELRDGPDRDPLRPLRRPPRPRLPRRPAAEPPALLPELGLADLRVDLAGSAQISFPTHSSTS